MVHTEHKPETILAREKQEVMPSLPLHSSLSVLGKPPGQNKRCRGNNLGVLSQHQDHTAVLNTVSACSAPWSHDRTSERR